MMSIRSSRYNLFITSLCIILIKGDNFLLLFFWDQYTQADWSFQGTLFYYFPLHNLIKGANFILFFINQKPQMTLITVQNNKLWLGNFHVYLFVMLIHCLHVYIVLMYCIISKNISFHKLFVKSLYFVMLLLYKTRKSISCPIFRRGG